MELLEEMQIPDCDLSCFEGLVELVEKLPRTLSIPEIEEILSRLKLQEADYGKYVIRDPARFKNPADYERVLEVEGEFASLRAICWLTGHESPIHDHKLSECGVIVVEGEMTETLYGRVAGSAKTVNKIAVTTWGTGVVTSTRTGVDIHKVTNEKQGQLLFTLHLYSPPLTSMTYYAEAE